MGAALQKVGLGEAIDPLAGLKTREEKLEKVFTHVDRYDVGEVTMGELCCMAEKLDKNGLEEVRREFIKLDQDQDGKISKMEFVDYYLDQLENYEEQEFDFWCLAIYHLRHYSKAELYKVGVIDEHGEDTYQKKRRLKQEAEEARIKKLAEDMYVDPVQLKRSQNKKMELQRIQMIVNGSGSLNEYDETEILAKEAKENRRKARMKGAGRGKTSQTKSPNVLSPKGSPKGGQKTSPNGSLVTSPKLSPKGSPK